MKDTDCVSRIDALLTLPPDALSVENVALLFQALHLPHLSGSLPTDFPSQITRQLTSYCLTSHAPTAALEFLRHASFLGRFFGLTVIESLPKPLESALSLQFLDRVLSALACSLLSDDPQERVFQNKAIATVVQLVTSPGFGSCPWLGYATQVLFDPHLSTSSRNQSHDMFDSPPISELDLGRLSKPALMCLLRLSQEYGVVFTSKWWPSQCLDPPRRLRLIQTLRDVREITNFALEFPYHDGMGSVSLADDVILVRSLGVENLCVWGPSASMASDPIIKHSFRGLLGLAVEFLTLGRSPKVCEVFRELISVDEFRTVSDDDFLLVGRLFAEPNIVVRLSESPTGDPDCLPYLRLFLSFAAEHARKTSLRDDATEFLPSIGAISADQMQAMVFTIMTACDPPPDNPILSWYLEFWNTVVDSLTDVYCEETPTPWYKATMPHVCSAIELFISKSAYSDESQLWTSDEKEEFLEFRRDIGEILLNFHSLCGPHILFRLLHFRDALFQSPPDWKHLELMLWCISVMADALDEEDVEWGDSSSDEVLQLLLSPLFDSSALEGAPVVVQISAARVANNLGLFFRRRHSLLPTTLRSMIGLLLSGETVGAACESLYTLCRLCGDLVTEQYSTLLTNLQTVTEHSSIDLKSRGKIVGSLGSVCGAKCRQEGTLSFLYDLLVLPATQRNYSRSPTASSTPGVAESTLDRIVYAQTASTYLAALSKSFHASEAFSGDKSAFSDGISSSEHSYNKQLAQMEALVREENVHDQIRDLFISLLHPFRNQASIVEPLCAALKAGFSETCFGPFVLPCSHFLTLISFIDLSSPEVISTWLSCACSFLSSLVFEKSCPQDRIASIVGLHRVVVGVVEQYSGVHDRDEDIDVSVLQLASSLCRFYPSVGSSGLLSSESLVEVLLFAGQALSSTQPNSRVQAIQFWVKYLSLTSEPPECQLWLDKTLSSVHNQLCIVIMERIMLHALRGEITHLTKLLHSLVRRHVHSKRMIVEAVMETLPQTRATKEEADVFVKSLMHPRLQRVVQTFWEQCLGLDK